MNMDFEVNDNRFNARVSAIIFNKDKTKVLFFKVGNGNQFMLPGGRIEFFEDSNTAIKREIKEELDYDLDFKLCSVQENFLKINGKKITQYCFCYKAIYDGKIKKDKFINKDNDNQYFYWIDINKLSDYNIVPKSTYNLIASNDDIKHIIEVDD